MTDAYSEYPTDQLAAEYGPMGGAWFFHCVAGMHLGMMYPKPFVEEFDAVLTLATDAGSVSDGIRHAHIPISYISPDRDAFETASDWVERQVMQDRRVLVRSDGGRQRPALVIGLVVLRLGGSYFDAVSSVQHGRPDALTDFRFIDMLKAADAAGR